MERAHEGVPSLLKNHARRGGHALLPTPVVAEVWRGGAGRQARLADFLKDSLRSGYLRVIPLDYDLAKRVGILLGKTHMSVADGSVCVCAQEYGAIVVTSDPRDIQRVIPLNRIRIV